MINKMKENKIEFNEENINILEEKINNLNIISDKINKIKENIYSINIDNTLIYQGYIISKENDLIFNDFGKLWINIDNIDDYDKYKLLYKKIFNSPIDNIINNIKNDNKNYIFPLIISYSGNWNNGLFNNDGILNISINKVTKKKDINSDNNENSNNDENINLKENYDIVPIKYNYSGNWNNGLQHGNGHEKHFNNEKYIGTFKYGLRHGTGMLLNKFGRVKYNKDVKWINGKVIGDGDITDFYENGAIKYIGKYNNDMYNGKGILYYNSGLDNINLSYKKYEGQFKNNNYEGKGKLYYSIEELSFFNNIKDNNNSKYNHIKYEGQFKNNNYHGKGVLKFPNNKICYDGNFYNNFINEKNEIIIYYNDGHPLYKGFILNNIKNDNAVDSFDNSHNNYKSFDNYDEYQGKKNNKPSCDCSSCRKKYEKNYEKKSKPFDIYKLLNFHFIPHGKGKYYNILAETNKSTMRYNFLEDGNYNCGKLHGKSIIFYPNNNICIKGSFVDNKMNGLCEKYLNNKKNTKLWNGIFKNNLLISGDIFYKNGKKYYSGKIKYPDNLSIDNIISNDKLGNNMVFYGQSKFYYNNDSNNIEYTGNLDNNKYNGYGTLYSSNGIKKYEGEWVDGRRNGQGNTYYESEIIQYMGTWINDDRNGEGTIFDSEGTMIVTGMFENNELIG
jgi:antitoxin component YwqK of YwqJK toxin-antitoxin module